LKAKLYCLKIKYWT